MNPAREPMILGGEMLRGDKVYLDTITRDDIPLAATWWRDLGFLRHMRRNYATLASADEVEGFYNTWWKGDDHGITFAIRTLADARLVGLLGIKDITWQARHCFFWIGIGDAADRGKGYGSDAVRLMLRYVFLELNLQRVALEVGDFNPAARRSYEKVGFTHEGTLRRFMFRDGVYYDMHIMAILREEWAAKHPGEMRGRFDGDGFGG